MPVMYNNIIKYVYLTSNSSPFLLIDNKLIDLLIYYD